MLHLPLSAVQGKSCSRVFGGKVYPNLTELELDLILKADKSVESSAGCICVHFPQTCD